MSKVEFDPTAYDVAIKRGFGPPSECPWRAFTDRDELLGRSK